MTLSFTQTIDGLPNYFIEKIWEGLPEKDIDVYDLIVMDYRIKFGCEWDGKNFIHHLPKIHTIRANRHSKWRAGMDIHFVINNRQKNRFQFAPVVKCISVQEIWILKFNDIDLGVKIDGRNLTASEAEEMARNDGFEDADGFYKYFLTNSEYGENFYGKIIHWTDKRY